VDSPVKLEPGTNTYTLDWAPTSAGQFILSTLEIVWKEGFFYYDSTDLTAPLLGVDVLPSEPTHSLSLDPGYLVPGHDQQVRITFDAGSDLVTTGKIQLSCSEGLTLIPPGEDPGTGKWQSDCEIELGECKPGEKTVLTTHVRCGLIENFSRESISRVPSLDVAHGLCAKAFTTYLHAEADSGPTNVPNMKSVLEAVAPILEKTALSVESVDAVWYTPGERAMVSINLMSNTPHHFSVVEWKLILPAPLQVAEGVDLNGDLLKCTVSDGDQLSLAFECVVCEGEESKSSDEPILSVVLCDDIGKEFTLDLSLDLNYFYLMLWEGDSAKLAATLTATLSMDVNEGSAGEPVMMTFTVGSKELSGLKPEGGKDLQLFYAVDSEGSDWLIGGKVSGTMDLASPSCEVVGIPAVPGVLSRFPILALRYSSGNGEMVPVRVKFQHPPAFQSLSKVDEVAVAYPSSKVSV
jgi:hypothetical protein